MFSVLWIFFFFCGRVKWQNHVHPSLENSPEQYPCMIAYPTVTSAPYDDNSAPALSRDILELIREVNLEVNF